MSKKLSISPDYKNIIKEIAKFLYQKKFLLARRVIVLIWPFIILFFSFPLFKLLNGNKEIDSSSPIAVIIILFIIIWGLFSLIWINLQRIFLFIEKIIWIDSFYDKKSLSDKESRKISKKLIKSVVFNYLKLFFNYYIFGYIIYFALVILTFLIMIKWTNNVTAFSFFIFLVFGPLVSWVYFYYIDIKLRYFWFIYLDRFGGEDFSFKKIKKEMLNLNKVAKSEAFKKILVSNFGIASINSISKGIVNLLTFHLSKLGDLGKTTSQSINYFTTEYTNQATSIGRIITKYLLYKNARKLLN